MQPSRPFAATVADPASGLFVATISPAVVACSRLQISRVQPAVVMPLDADEEEVTFSTAADTAPPQPYLQYGPDDSGGGGDKGGGGGGGDNGGGGEPCFSN